MNRGDPTTGTRSPSLPCSSSKSEVKECPICLQEIRSRGMIPCCPHEFCYVCILEWSKVTNECPLCKRTFHEIQVMNKATGRLVSVPIQDHKQENDVIVENFIYDDRPNVNEYIEDGFLVDDDAPIEYETQLTQSTTTYYPSFTSTSDSYEALPRLRSRRQRQLTALEADRAEHETRLLLERRSLRRRRAVVVSDDEDFIEESPSLDMSVTPSGTSTVVLSSNGSSVSTPVLPTRHLQELDMLPREICADSSESVPLSSRQVCLDFTQLIFQPPALLPTDGTTEIERRVIIPETPYREKRSRTISEHLFNVKMSRLM
ncbi:hypothetical protein WA171_001118 [Blastocystis sp. BT1]